MKRFKRTKAPLILQLSNTECGIASLAMVFSYYNVFIPIEELRDQCGTSRDGCKASTLLEVAKRYGFNAEAYTVDVKTITQLTEPVIAFWKFSHYIVINYIKSNSVSINDPAQGEIEISMDEFDRSFTGVIINLSPSQSISATKRKLPKRSIIHSWLSESYLILLFLCLCLLIATMSPYLNSRIYSVFIDQYLTAKNNHLILFIIAFSLFFNLSTIATNYIFKKSEFKLNLKLSLTKISAIVTHTFRLPMLFYSLRQRSEVIAILTRAESLISSLVTHVIQLTSGLIVIFLCLLLMYTLNQTLTAFTLFITLIYSSLIYYLTRKSTLLEKSNANVNGKLYATMISTISNIETIKACSLEDRSFRNWQSLFYKKIMVKDKINSITTFLSCLMKSYNMLLLLIILCVGSHLTQTGQMTLGTLMAYYLLSLFFNMHIASTLKTIFDLQPIRTQHIRINDIQQYKIDNRYQHHALQPIYLAQNKTIISCHHLTFYYNIHAMPSLYDINIEIQEHQHIAFIGQTGSGKSTLAKLLCALYQPTHGEIKLYDRPLSSYSSTELAKLIAYVSQDTSLFSGTLYENLTLWRTDISLDVIYSAINTACLEDFVAKYGLDYQITEGANNISGGEKQRIDIARALIQNTPILILDEGTSALDHKTEARLIENLKKTSLTIIFVAHRLSTITHCDQVFTLSAGKINE